MKYFLLIVLSLTFCAGATAQDKKFEFQNECGDPSVESIIWTPVSGKIIEIVDGDSVIIKQSNGKLKTIDLVGIDLASNEAAAKVFLTDTLLKKKVEVSITSSRASDEKACGVVRLTNKDVNRLMIERGISTFREPEPCSFSPYWACVFQKLEEKAKLNKLGVWGK